MAAFVMTPEAVARFMIADMETRRSLYRSAIAAKIHARFGAAHAYQADTGDWVISPRVLRAFDKATEGTVTWDALLRAWIIPPG
jgi:GR25 family glycosyltransferase involved in LPS biosynthesis